MTSTTTAPVCVLRDVTVDRGARRVLSGVTLSIAAGEQTTLLGRSGSGKTSLLMVLSGLLRPAAGARELGPDPSEVMYVPQAASLLPELTALDNAALPLRLRGTTPAESLARAREALAAVGLAGAVDALPGELSGGMQQRVALARALAVRPALLLADEPTGALDAATSRQVMRVLRAAAEAAGTAVVVATHDRALAQDSDRVVEVVAGRVEADR